jgi:hypothetical protein
MQYTQIDPHRFAFIKPGGLTQPLPVVITTGPGVRSIQPLGSPSPPGLWPNVARLREKPLVLLVFLILHLA